MCLRGEMEVHVDVRRYRSAIERGGLEVPAAHGGFDLLVNAVANCLHDLGFYNIALRVDGRDDHDIAH